MEWESDSDKFKITGWFKISQTEQRQYVRARCMLLSEKDSAKFWEVYGPCLIAKVWVVLSTVHAGGRNKSMG